MLVIGSYPFVVYWGLTLVGPRSLAVILAAALLLRGVLSRARGSVTTWAASLILPAAAVVVGLAVAALLDEGRVFLMVPSVVNAALLVTFGRTLWRGPSMIEVFARMQGGQVSTQGVVAYCRAVTAVWCVFFVLNGGVVAWLAIYASTATWAFYTGFVAYILIGVLLAAEVAYRWWRFPALRERGKGGSPGTVRTPRPDPPRLP